MRTTDTLQIRVELQGDGTLRASLNDVGLEAERTQRRVSGAASAAGLLGQAIGTIGVAKLVTDLISVNREAEQLRVGLRTLEGSQAAAAERFKELQALAATTPLSVNQITASYMKLKNSGFDPMDGSMQAMIDTAATLGGGYETLSGIVLAFGQANNKGKLQGEEMLQLAERGVPVYRVLAEAMGITTDEVVDLASKGKLGRDAIALLVTELGELNAGAAAAQANTLDGAISALLDNIEQLAVALGDTGLRDVLTIIVSLVGDGIKVITDFLTPVEQLGVKTEATRGFMGGLSDAILMVLSGAKVAGAGVGVLVDYVLALQDAFSAAMEGAFGFYNVLELALNRDFEGAKAAAQDAVNAAAGSFENAQKRISNAHKSFADTYNDITAELAEQLNKLRGVSEDSANATDKDKQKQREKTPVTGALSEATKKAREEIQKLTVALLEEINAHGKSEAELQREQAERLRVAGATDAQVEALLLLIDAREAQRKAAADSQRRLEAEKKALEEAGAATDTFQKLLREQAEQIGGPSVRAAFEYADALAAIAERERTLLQLGPPKAEDLEEIANARTNATKIYTDASREAALQSLEGFGAAWAQGISDLAPALTDALMTGDWGDVGKRLGQTIVGNLIETLMDQAIVKPLQDALLNALQGEGGGGFAGLFKNIANGFRNAGNGGNGANGGNAGQGNDGGVNWLGGVTGAYGAYQAYRSGDPIGGLVSGAMAGASFGGPVGAIVGGIVGALGGLFGGAKDPDLRLGGVGVTRKPERTFSTVFGDMQIGVRGGVDMESFINQMQSFDESIATMIRAMGGGAEEIAAISAALATWSVDLSGNAINAEDILSSRLNVVIAAVEPTWAKFLSGFSTVQERIEQFTALYAIRDQIEDLDSTIARITGGPLGALRAELDALTKTVDDSMAALATAIEAQNPAEIEAAAAAAQAAVIARYEAEVQMVRSLESALISAQAEARAMDIAMAQRIAGLTGDYTGVASAARIGIITSQAGVQGSTDPDRALGFLDEFVGHVDTWLQSSIEQMQVLIDRVDQLRATIAQVEAQGRSFDLRMAERIGQLGGGYGDAVNVSQQNMGTTRGLMAGASDPQQALGFLDEFISSVDSWLQNSIAEVQRLADLERQRINTALAGIAEQQAALQSALSTLNSERDAITAQATQRAQEWATAVNAAAQAAAQAARELQQSQLSALQEQLGIAQAFQRVIDQSRAMIEQLTFSTSNPLGGQARLTLLEQEIAAAQAAMSGASGADQAAFATRLMELLNQRLQLVQSEGLMQRPGDDYLALYNETLAALAGVQDIAEPEADAALVIQEEIARLQAMTFDSVQSISATVRYSQSEQARLNAIAEEEAEIQKELERLEKETAALQAELLEVEKAEAAAIAELNEEAKGYYEWARAEGVRLREDLLETLNDDLATTLADLRELEIVLGGNIDEIKKQAREYYEWAKSEAARLQSERAAALEAQINAITGGRPIEQFIADRQAETTRLLGLISTDLRAFLDAISGGTYNPAPGAGGGGSGTAPGNGTTPPSEGVAPTTVSMPVTLTINTAGGDPNQIAAAVNDALQSQMPQIATRVKRELTTA